MPSDKPGSKPTVPLGGATKRVTVNTQKTLISIVGEGFQDEAWEYPKGLLPADLPNLTYVRGPEDRGIALKAAWRMPVIYTHKETGISVAINGYRKRPEVSAIPVLSNPFATMTEPDYPYRPIDFHELKAASASEEGSDLWIFREGDILFKIEASGEKAKTRRDLIQAVASAIWKSGTPSSAMDFLQ